MKKIRLSKLIAKHLFSLGFVVLFFFVILLILSAYDLEDKILISLLKIEAEQVSRLSSVEDYNKVSSNQFTLYYANDLPEWAQTKFENELLPVREMTNDQNEPVHGIILNLKNTERVVLIFETKHVVQATRHIFDIYELIVSGCLIFLFLGAYYINQVSKKIALPIKNFAEFVHHNDTLNVYESSQDALSIVELQHLVDGYNTAVHQQISAIQREKQLNQDISHELRTPLAILYGSLEVLKTSCQDEHKEAALNRVFKINAQIQDLVNGVLWLAKEVTPDDLGNQYCNVDILLKKTALESSAYLGVANKNISMEINNPLAIYLPNEILQVIFRNIIVNAISYSSDNKVSIKLSEFMIYISNTGKLPEEGKSQGFGIGLSIVSRLCDKFSIAMDFSSNGGKVCCRLDLKALSKAK